MLYASINCLGLQLINIRLQLALLEMVEKPYYRCFRNLLLIYRLLGFGERFM